MLKIYKYIILLISLFPCFSINALSQNKAEEKTSEEKIPVYQGIKIEYDVASLVVSAFSKGETYSTEGNVQVNLKQKYFPTVEFGFAGANKISQNDYGYKTNGFFGKIGIDYNLLKPKAEEDSFHRMFLVGARLGMTHFSYDITNITISNGYWGGEEIRDFYDQKATRFWFEIVAGLRVEIFKNVYMGWSVRKKFLFGNDKYGEVSPWYIPGLGKKDGGNWGFNYTIGYAF